MHEAHPHHVRKPTDWDYDEIAERDQLRADLKEAIEWADYWHSLLMGSHEGGVTDHSLEKWQAFKERTKGIEK